MTSQFPVAVRPTFLAATDNRIVIVSGDGFFTARIESYSALTGTQLGDTSGYFADYGQRLILSPYGTVVYVVPLDPFFYSSCVRFRVFNFASGELRFPSGPSEPASYCINNDVITGLWVLDGGNKVLLSDGSILRIGGSPLDLHFSQRLEKGPAHLALQNGPNNTLFTMALGAPNLLHQFNLGSFSYGSSFEVTNSGNYYWMGANGDTLWLGRVSGGHTFLESFANPAAGGATNSPPSPQFVYSPDQPTTTNIVTFDGAASLDLNTPHEDLSFRWVFFDGRVVDWTNSPITSRRFNLAGTNRVALVVRDRFGSVSNRIGNVVVTAVADLGQAPTTTNLPFVLPFVLSSAAFHPVQPRLYGLSGASNRLIFVNLSNGVIEREFEFDFPPQALAVTPDGQRLFVTLGNPSGTSGFLAEFQTEPLLKLRELPIPVSASRIVAVTTNMLLLGGNSANGLSVRTFTLASNSAGNFISLGFGLAGLAVNATSDRVYIADETWTGNSLQLSLTPAGMLTNQQYLPAGCGTGDFYVLPPDGWLVRSSGDICTSENSAVTNLGFYLFAVARADSRSGFIAVDGLSRLRLFSATNAALLGGYTLARRSVFLNAQDDWVYSVTTEREQTFIERRLLPASAETNSPPVVTLSVSGNEGILQAGDSISFTIRAVDLDGDITQLALSVNGNEIASGPSATWLAPGPGVYDFLATGKDDFGASGTSAPVRVMVSFPPRLSSLRVTEDSCELNVSTDAARWIFIESSTDLFDWVSIGTNYVSGPNNRVVVPRLHGAGTQFFRAVVQP